MKNSFSTLLRSYLLAATGVTIAAAATATPVQAIQLGFNNISGNNATDAFVGTQQLFVNVTDAQGGENLSATQALFKFSNKGPATSSITQIYFDDFATLLGKASIDNTSNDVLFSEIKKNNLNLPAGKSVNFHADFGVAALSPVQRNGANPGESVGILFNLKPQKTLQNVFSDLTSGNLRLGIHVQGFENGGSETFVNKLYVKQPQTEPKKVPEPANLVGLGVVAGILVGSQRRKSNKTRN